MLQHGLSFGEATQHYSLLTVGDGLAAQIPALLISIATGIIVTRSASERDLGCDIANQILRQRKAPMVAGGVICAFGLVPGLPKLPFLFIGGDLRRDRLGGAQRRRPDEPRQPRPPRRRPAPRSRARRVQGRGDQGAPARPARARRSASASCRWSTAAAAARCVRRVSMIRRQIAAELGIVIPPVRIHDEVGLDSHEYVFKVRGAEVARGRIMAGHQLAMDPGDAGGALAGIPTTEPAFGLPAIWIADGQRAEAEALGYTVVDGESVIVTHLTETIRRHAAELLTRQDVRQLLDQLKETNAAVVDEVVPDVLSLGEVQRVLQSLLPEGVSIRDLGTIVEAVGDKARVTRDPACSPSTPARRSAARSPPRTSTRSRRCARSRSTPRSSRRSPSRSPRPPTASTSRWIRPAPRPSSALCAARSSRPPPVAACARCCSARRACAATCAAWSRRRFPSLQSAPTTRSPPASASRRSES